MKSWWIMRSPVAPPLALEEVMLEEYPMKRYLEFGSTTG